MFAPPEVIPTEIFATLPEDMRRDDRDAAFSNKMMRGQRIASFLEGPSFDRDGNLYVVDIAHGRIFRISPQAAWSLVADYDGEPNGLKIHKDGRIFVADHKNGIIEVDPVNGDVTVVLGRDDLPGYKGVNDLFFASNGDLYFTDQGESGWHDPTGRVFRYRADGRLDCLLDNVPSPNGLVMNPDETILWLAVTRANAVWRVPFHLDGAVGRVGTHIQLSGGVGPDGMAIDVDGNIAIAHAGMGAVWLFTSQGVPLYKIESCARGHTTNLAYGGPDNKSMFITESASGSVLRAVVPVAGGRMFAHM